MVNVSSAKPCDLKTNLLRLPNVAERDQAKATTIVVNVSPETRAIIEDLVDATGMAQTKFAARVFQWFAAQDRKFCLAVVSKDEATQRELMRLSLQQAIGMDAAGLAQASANLDPEAAAIAARALIDQLESLAKMYAKAVQQQARKGK
jgi:hypothetical protein